MVFFAFLLRLRNNVSAFGTPELCAKISWLIRSWKYEITEFQHPPLRCRCFRDLRLRLLQCCFGLLGLLLRLLFVRLGFLSFFSGLVALLLRFLALLLCLDLCAGRTEAPEVF